jgi:hypothetical protein
MFSSHQAPERFQLAPLGCVVCVYIYATGAVDPTLRHCQLRKFLFFCHTHHSEVAESLAPLFVSQRREFLASLQRQWNMRLNDGAHCLISILFFRNYGCTGNMFNNNCSLEKSPDEKRFILFAKPESHN